MHDIILKTYELIDALDDSDLIVNLTKYKELVVKDRNLMILLDRGNNSSDVEEIRKIKQELYSNDNYKNYMQYYNELFYIIIHNNDNCKIVPFISELRSDKKVN